MLPITLLNCSPWSMKKVFI
ncbi:hypothetical protein BON23_5355 [Saccharomyces cerevisiae]|nr:hypothetical protein BON23_5355 [Saccharomyces cerevisiae]